jgi:phenylpropionate dioxygenase-like ring-hydroxylating dioxygenase large terminal subunit
MVPLRCETWQQFIFVNFSNHGPSLVEYVGNIPQLAREFSFEGLALAERRDYTVQCNWKVYVDNYLEGYHIPIVHPGLMKEIDYPRYRCETFRYHSQQLGPVRPLKAGDGFERVYPPGIGLKEALYFWVFPNLMLNIYPDNVQTNLIVPLAHDKTLTIFEWYFHDANSAEVRQRAAKAIEFSHVVQQEDMHICEAVQRGLQSAAYDRGRYSVKRENGVHHFHRLLAEFLG